MIVLILAIVKKGEKKSLCSYIRLRLVWVLV